MDEQVAAQSDDIIPSGEFIVRDAAVNLDPLVPRPNDTRLYLPKHNGWSAQIKQNWEQEYCYSKFPGEDWFHFLANGEIFIVRGTEKFCLTCALRLNILTRNRLFWQKGSSEAAEVPPLDQPVSPVPAES